MHVFITSPLVNVEVDLQELQLYSQSLSHSLTNTCLFPEKVFNNWNLRLALGSVCVFNICILHLPVF